MTGSHEPRGPERETPEDAEEGQTRRRVKVTDKRRVHPGDEPQAEGSAKDASDALAPEDAAKASRQGPDAADAATDPDIAQRRADEYLEHLQRLQAEFENYRKRVLREQTRAVEFAAEPLVSRLLEVLDEFELALVAAEQRPDFDKFLRGVEMVYAKLADILRGEGLERIEAEGKPFDPEEHEALLQAEGGEGEPYVADVLRTGYRLKGRVIRPAGVKVARR